MYVNVRGILSKIQSLQSALEDKKPNILAICESHMNGNNKPQIENYREVIIKNKKGKGGGILIAVRDDSDLNMVASYINAENEQIWIKFQNKKYSFIVAVLYGHACESRASEQIDEWYYQMEKSYSEHEEEPILLVGDFNAHIGCDEEGLENNHPEINQNGRKLRSVIERRNLALLNGSKLCEGMWTREDPNGKRSVLDYAISNEKMLPHIVSMKIDEEHQYKISRYKKGVETPSDHNTIFVTLDMKVDKKTSKRTIWNYKNQECLDNYTAETSQALFNSNWEEDGDTNTKYKRWIKQVKTIMYKCIKRITISGKKANTETKRLLQVKRSINKEINHIKQNGVKNSFLYKYYLTRIKEINRQVSDEIIKMKNVKIQKRLDKIAENKSSISNEIWNIRRKAIGKSDPKLVIKSKDGVKLYADIDIKNRYKQYYEELLEPREPSEGYSEHAKEIEQIFQINMQIKSYDDDELNQPFDMEELELVISELKRNKCPGPDEIPNELIKYAGTSMKSSILQMLNHFFKCETIPEELTKLNIKSIYKGKGETGNLANHRGLFIGNTLAKMYERLKLNRIYEELKFSEYQAGGRKQHGIADQLFILYSIIEKAKYENISIILQFMDLIKAFDKMLLKAVMIDLWKSNIRGRIWRSIYNLNKQSLITIKTPYGDTEEIRIGETLKQGSVLASILAALHTDNIKDYFQNSGLGLYYNNVHIPNLLFQDDIVRIETDPDKMNTANRRHKSYQEVNRMKFHEDKTVVVNVNNKSNKQISVILDAKPVKQVNQHKYLGDIITEDGTHEATIAERENSITGTTAEISNILSETSEIVKMKSIRQYTYNIILPKLTINTETWNLTNENIKHLEKIYSQAIKRMLKIPYTTPTKGLLNELGLWSIENEIIYRKLMFLHKLINGDTLSSKIFSEQCELPGPTWAKQTIDLISELEMGEDIDCNKIKDMPKDEWRRRVLHAINGRVQDQFEEFKNNSVKCKNIKYNLKELSDYLEKMKPKEAKVILLARLGMTNIKCNFPNQYERKLTCELCGEQDENLVHLLNCKQNKLTDGETEYSDSVITNIYKNDDLEFLTNTANDILIKINNRDKKVKVQNNSDGTLTRFLETEGSTLSERRSTE